MNSTVSTIACVIGRCDIGAWAHKCIDSILGYLPTWTPPNKSYFPVDTLGVAGIFGGDDAMSAMATVHVYENRRSFGWYNSPGSYQVAKRLDLLSKSRSFDSSFCGVHTDPATFFNLDGSKRPKFTAVHSGTIIEETGPLAALFMKECTSRKGEVVEGRETTPVGVTIAELKGALAPETVHKRINTYSPVVAGIPIITSFAACVVCGVVGDWYSFSLILLGILTNGISCCVIGSGKLRFIHPDPSWGSPPGDGILIGSDGEVILLMGAEGAVNSLTRGRFSLDFSSEYKYQRIGWCRTLIILQTITRLLLVPRSSLSGQIMFATSLAVSWFYNLWLASWGKEKIQWNILFNSVLNKPDLAKYTLGTYTAAVVFVLLILQPEKKKETLDRLLPNDTKVWRKWKGKIIENLQRGEQLEFVDEDSALDDFTQAESFLLKNLYDDAQAGYRGYTKYRDATSK